MMCYNLGDEKGQHGRWEGVWDQEKIPGRINDLWKAQKTFLDLFESLKKTDHSFAGSLPNAYCSPNWAKAKARSQESNPGVPHGVPCECPHGCQAPMPSLLPLCLYWQEAGARHKTQILPV